ncbi:MAG: 5-histidylcysteine sulfoxide synthase [Burkholderiales bacterium]|nr:5-histidylcysteine sulfoxide synthase [Burkholderiales bacterium]
MRNDSRLLFPRTPDLRTTDPIAFRRTLGEYFHSTFSTYESLFEALVDEDSFRTKPISLRHPLIFYYGHTATFFTNKFVLAGLISERIDPRFESMFAVGVDEMSWDDLNEAHYDWPTAAAVRAYRDKVRAMVDRVIREAPLQLPVDWDNPWWAVIMGVEHERIHLETSSVLIRQHALGRVRPLAAWSPDRSGLAAAPTPFDAPANALVPVPAGTVRMGKALDDPIYGWDNEYGERKVELPAFEAGRMLVSNAEYLAFVEAGGYADPQWWDEEGEGWRRYSLAQAPTFWVREGVTWKLRLMTEVVPMPWNWPVEVNCLEARAFCRWMTATTGRNHRLPTEDEWYRLYDVAGIAEVPHDRPAAANLHLDHGASSCPVDRHAQGDFFDVVGNVWQWTETPIYPFEGFRVHDIYDDFSTPTFDGRHNLMKGGSWASCGNESIRASRYAFRRHFFQHAGLRYVVTDTPAVAPNVYYESDRQLAEYVEFHFGDECFGVPNFPRALAQIAIAAIGDRPARTALDLGCATGRATFELAKHFGHVTGVDFSARFINAGVQLRDTGELRYQRVEEGDLVSYQTRTLAALGLVEVAGKVDFLQGDACNLKTVLTGYDLILAANLIDRLYDPMAFLGRIHERLNVGGVLMLSSPYTWLEDHTSKENWLGGFKKDGESWTTLDALKAALAPHFRMLGEPRDVAFVIRETRRKHQHTLAEVTVWERVA